MSFFLSHLVKYSFSQDPVVLVPEGTVEMWEQLLADEKSCADVELEVGKEKFVGGEPRCVVIFVVVFRCVFGVFITFVICHSFILCIHCIFILHLLPSSPSSPFFDCDNWHLLAFYCCKSFQI